MRSTRPASLGRLPAGPGRLDIALVLLALLVVTSCRQRELRDAGAPGSPGLAAQPQPPGPAPALDPAQDDDQDGTRDDNRDQPVQVLYPITPGTFAAAAAELHGAVVNIRSTRPAAGGPASIYPGAPPDPSLGSGVIIDRAGYILTNHHIIAQANDIRVVLHSGTELGAAVAGTDPRTDIALLTLSDPLPRDAAIAQLGDSDHPRSASGSSPWAAPSRASSAPAPASSPARASAACCCRLPIPTCAASSRPTPPFTPATPAARSSTWPATSSASPAPPSHAAPASATPCPSPRSRTSSGSCPSTAP